jgi:hypothetical protein
MRNTNYLLLNRGLYPGSLAENCSLLKKNCSLENINWQDIKASRKTEVDLRDIAYDSNKLIAAALK